MKLIFLHILVVCQLSIAFAQNEVWVPVKDMISGVAVKMPQLPKYEQEELFTADGSIVKEIFSTEHNGVKLYFEVQPILSDAKKAHDEAINKAFKLIAIQNQGTPGKKQKLKKDDFTYHYVETPLVTGKLIRSVAFVYNERLIHIYMKGSIDAIFDIDANYYLASWSLPNIVETSVVETKTEAVEIDEEVLEQLNWISVELGDGISTKFPGKPFKKESFIERGKSDLLVTSFAYTALEDRLNYVATKRVYNSDEGQLTDDALFAFLTDRVVANKHLKKLKTIETNNGKQYVFSKGIRFYRLHLIRVDDTLYQFLVKGKRKSIYSPKADYFFNQTSSDL
ncbi:MAG: hypothetical protein R2753_16475 [Chitinophagales bacterium]